MLIRGNGPPYSTVYGRGAHYDTAFYRFPFIFIFLIFRRRKMLSTFYCYLLLSVDILLSRLHDLTHARLRSQYPSSSYR